MIPFNKPYFTNKEINYVRDSLSSGHVSGNGSFTKSCQNFFQQRWNFQKCLLTTSCTDALEMCALLLDLEPGDEVIVPSYTFVSTALAFVRTGAKVVFVDSRPDHPGLDETLVESLITPKTRAIVAVHYAGVACDMDVLVALSTKHDLILIEDAAQAIDSMYKRRPLGGIGHLGCFSFHETKNIQCGEGGMLVVNDDRFIPRSEILWEKGTNRTQFFRGEVNKYGWVDTGSSFLASDLSAAVLMAQLESLDKIQKQRLKIWHTYDKLLRNSVSGFKTPEIPDYATNNAHNYYLVAESKVQRDRMIAILKSKQIHAVFHYLPLHLSEFYLKRHPLSSLPNAEYYGDCLLRLPFHLSMSISDVEAVSQLFMESA